MKKIIIAMAAIAAAFTMASCNKELAEPKNNPAEGNCIITASTESSLTKTSLDGNDKDGYNVVWSEGDSFVIGDKTFTLTAGEGTTNGTFKGDAPADNEYKVYYPSSYDGNTWPAEQTYKKGNITGSPMKADVTVTGGKASDPISFTNAGGILRLTVKGSANILVASITVSASGLQDITLNCGDGVSLDETNGTVFHIAMPEGSYSATSILLLAKGGKTCIKKLSSRNLEIERSKITPALFSASFTSTAPEGALPEAFTVSADGKMVFFSKGNLWCDTDTNPEAGNFHFEDNQYDTTPKTNTDRDDKHISHFMWCSSAADAVKSNYSETGKSADDILFTNVAGFTVNAAGNWYAPSRDEMCYLLMSRKASTVGGKTNARYFSGRIDRGSENFVNGLFVIPDVFTWPESELPNAPKGINEYRYNYTDNTYSVSEFAVLQQAGIVFLPCAGKRDGDLGYSSVNYVNNSGYYWYSTLNNADKAGHLGFSVSGSVLEEMANDRGQAYSIRLVTDSTPIYTVTFDMNGRGTAPADIILPYCSKINEPAKPTFTGYVFAGWYKDPACIDEWNFETDRVTADITLHAKWVADVDVLPGVFTIADDGKGNVKKVHFSKGNLIATIDATGLPTAWNFAENQYYYLGEGGANTTIGKAAGDVDLFGWSTDFKTYGISTSFSDDDYLGDFVEWGSNIDDGKHWRTMTGTEWLYLIFNHSCKWVTVCGVNGYVVAPDGASLPQDKAEYTESELNEAALLFLPAAGYRIGTHISDGGVGGYYWSSTPNTINAYCLSLKADDVNPGVNSYRWYGRSVRLVMDLTDTYTVTFDMNGRDKAPYTITGIQTHSTINEPEDIPTAMGYIFAGWYKDRECTVKWDFNSDIVTENTTIYARWTEAPAGALPGVFSISEGKRIYFSKGNLVASIDASGVPTAWKFYDNQYEYLNEGGANKTIGEAAGDVDLFGWSTRATHFGISVSVDNKDYSGDFYDWGNVFEDNETWRTLTTAEWDYILNTRKMSHVDFRYSLYISYCGNHGLVLYQDSYNGPALVSGTNYTEETFPEDCVFLPSGRFREARGIYEPSIEQGRYWSSTVIDPGDAGDVGCMSFYPHNVRTDRLNHRYVGYSVRLVTDMK